MNIDARYVDFQDPATYHDRVLVVGETKFHVVSGILSMWSDHFRAMFEGSFAEANKNEIELKEVDPENFNEFLKLIYGITNDRDIKVVFIIPLIDMSFRFLSPRVLSSCEAFINIYIGKPGKLHEEKLLRVACKYDIESLKTKLISFFTNDADLSMFHSTEILDIVVEYNLKVLKDSIIQFVAESATVLNCSGLLDYSVTKNLPCLKEGIVKLMAVWHEYEQKKKSKYSFGGVTSEHIIPQNIIISLVECAFEHNSDILKTILRDRIFYLEKKSAYSSREHHGGSQHVVTINTFFERNRMEIFALPKEIMEFILTSTISPT